MKLGVAICGEQIPLPSESAKRFYDNGINTIELGYNKNFASDEIKRLKELGMDFSIHGFWKLRLYYPIYSLMIGKPKFYFPKCQVKEIEKGFSIAEKLDATHYVLHGGTFPKGYFRLKILRRRKEFSQTFIKTFKPLFSKAKNTGIKIVLENLTKGYLFSDVEDIIAVQRECRDIGFCLDFGHSEIMNQTDLLRKLKIDHVHASDNDLINDSHITIGSGRLDFNKLYSILKEQNFKGKVLAECSTAEEAIESVKYLRRIF